MQLVVGKVASHLRVEAFVMTASGVAAGTLVVVVPMWEVTASGVVEVTLVVGVLEKVTNKEEGGVVVVRAQARFLHQPKVRVVVAILTEFSLLYVSIWNRKKFVLGPNRIDPSFFFSPSKCSWSFFSFLFSWASLLNLWNILNWGFAHSGILSSVLD